MELLDAQGKPIRAKDTTPPLGEAASILLSTLFLYGGMLQPDDDTLATRGGGQGLKIYRRLERDAKVGSCLGKRYDAVTARPLKVTPASDSPRDVAAAERVERYLAALPFKTVCRDLLDAILMGFSVGEIMWAVEADGIRPAAIVPRAQTRFKFDVDYKLRLLTTTDTLRGIEMPDRKFIVHRHGGKDNNPYGLGLGSSLFWPVLFKRQGVSFWLTFLDKFGSPTPLGKYPSNATKKEKDTLLSAAKSLRQESATIIPDGMALELLETGSSANTGYSDLVRYMDEEIVVTVLGEVVSTTAAGSGGLGSGEGASADDVREERARADSEALCDTLQQTLVRWIVDANEPGAGYPTLAHNFEDEEDSGEKADRDKTLVDAGFEPTPAYVTEAWPGWTFKGKAPAVPMPAQLPGQPPAQQPPTTTELPVEFGAPDPVRTALDDLIDASMGDWQPAMESLLGPVEALLAAAEKDGLTLAQVRDRLPALVGQGTGPLEQSLTRAQFAARAAGVAGIDTHGDLR